jgi:hypothetical protein
MVDFHCGFARVDQREDGRSFVQFLETCGSAAVDYQISRNRRRVSPEDIIATLRSLPAPIARQAVTQMR